jgi:hypothetical protein
MDLLFLAISLVILNAFPSLTDPIVWMLPGAITPGGAVSGQDQFPVEFGNSAADNRGDRALLLSQE